MSFDYASEYDNYWSSEDRFGEQSFADANGLVDEILHTCGIGKVLDIGSGMGQLVKAFLSKGIDAHGIDISQVAVDHANGIAPNRYSKASVLELPFENGAFDIVVSTDCLEHLAEDDVVKALKEIRRVTRRAVYMKIATTVDRDGHWHLTVKPRSWWENKFFEAGFRKHPCYYKVNNYESLQNDGWQITIMLEAIPEQALLKYPLSALVAERDLHMDMMRETGSRSDAHIARYEWATQYIRPGDTVLDAACGLGYGSYVLQAGSTAKRVVGIDGSEYAVDYATQNYKSVLQNLEFYCGMLPEALDNIPDHSVDVIVSFETLEHVQEKDALLKEFYRVLTPGGRIITSVPNDWSDETGEDPNPFHVHVYTLDKLRQDLQAHFILESLVAQSADQYKVGPERKTWAKAERSLKEVPLTVGISQPEPNAEWWLAVAMRSPIDGAAIPYTETTYPLFSSSEWNVTTYARDYVNPWLLRSMVNIGHRLKNVDALMKLAEQVIAKSPLESPDVGAALCVIAYQLLERDNVQEREVQQLEERILRYLNNGPKTPHGVRWSVSLQFVLGKLWLNHGVFEKAKAAFLKCTSIDELEFSPLLCNRTVEAYLILGSICIAGKDQEAAVEYWRRGILEARRAIVNKWDVALGDANKPAEFSLPELASTIEYASSCAYALNNINDVNEKPWWWMHLQRDRLSQGRKLEREYRHVKNELAHSKNEIKKYAEQAEHFVQHIHHLQENLSVTQALVNNIKCSRTWRYTKPIRDFIKALQKVRA